MGFFRGFVSLPSSLLVHSTSLNDRYGVSFLPRWERVVGDGLEHQTYSRPMPIPSSGGLLCTANLYSPYVRRLSLMGSLYLNNAWNNEDDEF